jgi:hypothetical protein
VDANTDPRELTMACGADEAKKLTVLSKDNISARRTTLTTSPMFMFATNADMLAWATESGRLITTRAEFDEVDDLDKLLVFSTFYFEIQVKDESPNAVEGATIPTTTFGFNFGSKRPSRAVQPGTCCGESPSSSASASSSHSSAHYYEMQLREMAFVVVAAAAVAEAAAA